MDHPIHQNYNRDSDSDVFKLAFGTLFLFIFQTTSMLQREFNDWSLHIPPRCHETSSSWYRRGCRCHQFLHNCLSIRRRTHIRCCFQVLMSSQNQFLSIGSHLESSYWWVWTSEINCFVNKSLFFRSNEPHRDFEVTNITAWCLDWSITCSLLTFHR